MAMYKGKFLHLDQIAYIFAETEAEYQSKI